MSMCRVISCVVGRGCLLWPVCSLGKTLLAFALLHSVFQGQICLLLQVFLTSYFGIPVSYNEVTFFLMLWKCCNQYAMKFGKLSNGRRTGKGQFHPNPKERQWQRMLKLLHNCTHLTHWQSNAQNSPSQVSTVWNYELPDVQADFRKGRGTRDQIANICWIIEKARVLEKHLFLLYWLCQSLWLCGSQ